MTTNSFTQVSTGKSVKIYNGLKVVRTWSPSNYHGTVNNVVTLPNGKKLASASWDNLKKQINKHLNA